ncbi:MAG: HD domain-containing protein [Pseudomonadota bacterium]|nr:HD domain-containing protein [Pseudomonadota bacterium]
MKMRAWQRMLSGRRLDLLDPTPMDVEVDDIAHGLSFLSRWNGQTLGAYGYSVAQHSLLVEELFSKLNQNVSPHWKLAALLHDAAEYVIGDLISPVKNHVGPAYNMLETRLITVIYQRFGLPSILPKPLEKKIKKADKNSAWLEAVTIAGFTKQEATKIFGKPAIDDSKNLPLEPLPPEKAKELFLKKHSELLRLI